jgi:hypothetical protein
MRPQSGSQGRIRIRAIKRRAAIVTPVTRDRRALVGVSVLVMWDARGKRGPSEEIE